MVEFKAPLTPTGMLALVNVITHLKGKHIKQTLTNLEVSLGVPLDAGVRKAVLDGYNNLSRSILAEFGYKVEE